MKLTLIAVGRLKAEEEALVGRYTKRIKGLQVVVLAERAQVEQEQAAILKALPDKGKLVVLDERGSDMKSTEFAHWLEKQAFEPITFVIGGANGLGDQIRARADLLLCFGAMTWPHQFIRAMLCEQLYRAQSILAGHPYHREN